MIIVMLGGTEAYCSAHAKPLSHLVAESTFFRLGACTLNCLGGLRHHNPNPNEPPNDERRKSWLYLEPRVEL
jgi:hypothetical protein